MNAYTCGSVRHGTFQVVVRLGQGFGIMAGKYAPIIPMYERLFPDYWYVGALGVTLWRDTSPPMTVGERGVW